jgi:hypothetical protein
LDGIDWPKFPKTAVFRALRDKFTLIQTLIRRRSSRNNHAGIYELPRRDRAATTGARPYVFVLQLTFLFKIM